MNKERCNQAPDPTFPSILQSGFVPGLASLIEASGLRALLLRVVDSVVAVFGARGLYGARRGWVWLCAALLLVESRPVCAVHPGLTVGWRVQSVGGSGFESSVLEEGGRVFLRVVNKTNAPCVVRLGRFEAPGLDSRPYAWKGEIRYEGVEGSGYLESWNEFAASVPGTPRPRYFSRTKSDTGPMADIRGSSPWRPLMLPFTPDSAGDGPTLIELNLHMAGVGIVDLGPLSLVQPEGGLVALRWGGVEGGWWTPRESGLGSGVIGFLLGCSGAAFGMLIKRGKGRAVVLALHGMLVGVGVLCIGVGLYAFVSRQPAHVWLTCVLFGVIIAPGYALSAVHARRQYNEAEMRRMLAADAAIL